MRRLLIGDKRVRLRDEGESARCPLVCLHGAGGSSVVWMDVVRRLSGRRRIIAPDLPGHGQSDGWADPTATSGHRITLDLYREFVGTLCASLGVQKVVLVGHSMGGAIALRVALAWPERVAGLVLVASGARLKVAPELLDVLATDFTGYGEWFRRAAFSPSTAPEVVDRWMAVAVQAPPEVVLADFRALANEGDGKGFDERARIGALKMPALCIGAADDLMTPPKLTLEAAAGLGNARAEVIPAAGHMLVQEKPEAFFAALEPFLAEVP